MKESSALFVASLIVVAFSGAAGPVQKPVQVGAFSAIDVRDNGHVVLRSGATHRVTFINGSPEYTRVNVINGTLVIDKCYTDCPRGYVLDLEITAPAVTSLSLANGGWIRTMGSFARQSALTASVKHGGTIDLRAMTIDRVDASVEQGGRILTVPRGSLTASVFQGGAITYWGNVQVKRSIEHGGVVQEGRAAELNVPLFDTGPAYTSGIEPSHPVRESKKRR
jgi:hypothetical protein